MHQGIFRRGLERNARLEERQGGMLGKLPLPQVPSSLTEGRDNGAGYGKHLSTIIGTETVTGWFENKLIWLYLRATREEYTGLALGKRADPIKPTIQMNSESRINHGVNTMNGFVVLTFWFWSSNKLYRKSKPFSCQLHPIQLILIFMGDRVHLTPSDYGRYLGDRR